MKMARTFLLMIFYFVLHIYCAKATGKHLTILIEDPDENRNVSELITSKGYPLEDHVVQTDDGYLLSVQRIPYGRKAKLKEDKGSVLLIHGILGDATNWILDFPNQSLGFILADKGYDVWLLNTRGSFYSSKHVMYTDKTMEFWEFSFQEVAEYDIPATIDYILNATGKENLYIIGHSQGNAASFAMLSEMPEYNSKVRLLVALCPISTNGHTTSPVKKLIPFKNEIHFLFEVLTAGAVMRNEKLFKSIKMNTCRKKNPEFCENIIFELGGMDSSQMNKTRLLVYAAHFPSGTSSKSLLHFEQLMDSKKFCKFDYGPSGNLEHYHQEEPPDYNPSLIRTPVALFWSANDTLSVPEDVAILRSQLNSLVLDYQVPYPYNHFDFVIALNAPKILYEPILKLLSKY